MRVKPAELDEAIAKSKAVKKAEAKKPKRKGNPNEGTNTFPFTCEVILDLKTKGLITGIEFPAGPCEGLSFQNLPWGFSFTDANSGTFGSVSFASAAGNCQTVANQLQDNKRGFFTLPAGQCLSGTLRSHPTVTIVP